MRLPWISQRQSQRSATRRKRTAPLRVRRLERRRVLDAAVSDLVFAPADVDGSTAIHDSNEGTEVTVTAATSGFGALLYEWKLTQGATVVAQSNNPAFQFTPLDDANYSVTLKITDSAQSVASRTESLIIQNVRPVLVVAQDQMVDEGSLLNLSAIGAPSLGLFIDDGILDTHTATVDWGDGSTIESPTIFAAAGSGALGGTHTYTDDGVYEVIVTITDDDGGTDTQLFFVTVSNVAPTATLSNDGPVDEGASATVSFSNQFDPSSDDTAAGFHYAYDLDSDGTFDVGDGSYAGSGTTDSQMISAALLADGPGTRTVKARIIDQDGGFTDYTTTITINNVAPTLINIAVDDDSIDEGQTATIRMTIDDPGAMDVFAVDVDWNDGAPLDTIVGLGMMSTAGTVGGTTYQWDAQTRELTVGHLYEDDNPTATSSDTYAVALTVRDDDLGATGPYNVDVTVSNVRPVLVVAADQMVGEGALLDLSAVGAPPLALFVDDGVLDTHSATVDWGDGSPSESPTLFVGPGSGALGATHSYQDNGVYMVTVTVTDDDGGSDTQSFEVTVGNVAPTAVLTNDGPVDEGSTATVSFSGQFDPSSDDTTAGFRYAYDLDNNGTFDVGDGTYAGSVATTSQLVSAALLADGPGTSTVKARIIDKDGGFTDYTTDTTVDNVRPVLVVATDQVIDEGALLDLSGVGAPPLGLYIDDGILDTHTATVDWGDGSVVDSPTVFAGPGSGALGATHTYTDNGVYTVTVTVTDDDDGFDTKQFFVTVGNVAPTAVLSNNGPVDEGSSAIVSFSGQFDPSTTDTMAGFRYAYDLDNNGTFDVGDGTYVGSVGTTSQLVSAALLAEGPGTHTVKGRIIDKDGGFTDYTTTITINNVAPELVNIVVDDATINEGQTATITMTIDDPGTLDTFEVDVDWKDGGPVDTILGLGSTNTSGTVGGTAYQWDAQTRELTVSHLYADDNPTATASDLYTVVLAVRDDDLGATGPYNVDVTVSNVRPVLVVADDQTVNEGALLDLSAMGAPPLALFIDDGKLDTHVATVDWGDGSAVQMPAIFFAAGSGALGASHTYADNGVYTVTVTVTDDDGGFDTQSFLVTVENVAPTLSVAPSAATIDEGSSVSFGATFSDPGFDNPLNPGAEKQETFTYDVDWGDGRDAITGMSVADTNGMPGVDSTGMFNGSHTYADNGVYTVTVTLHDDDGGLHTQTFMVTVDNVAPTLALPNGDQTIDEGALLSLANLGTFTDPGFDNPLNPGAEKQETFTYDVDWGDGRDAIAGQSIADTNGGPGVDSTGTIAGSHTYADNGVYTVTVTIHDDDGGSHIQSFMVTVDNVAPSLALPNGDQTIDEGTLLSLANLGTFTDPGFDNPLNPSGETEESFTYDVDWGDGRDAIAGQSIADTNGGPGVDSTGTIAGSHTYADNGVYTVTVTIHDDDGGSDTLTFTVTVNNVDPTLGLTPSTTSINEGQSVGFDALFSDPGFDNPLNPGAEQAESFTYDVDWGDNRDAITGQAVPDTNGSPGVPSTGSFGGSHTYADNGTYTVKVTIHDDDSGVHVQMFTVIVANVDPTLTGTSGHVVDEGEIFTLTGLGVGLADPGFDNLLNTLDPVNGGELTETFDVMKINWGDGIIDDNTDADLSDPISIVNRLSGGVGVTTTAQFDHAAHAYADNGLYTVTITIKDDDGNFVDRQFTIQVENVAPSLTLTDDSFTINEGQTLTIPNLGTFTDPGFNNPLNPLQQPGGSAETFTYTINWGDGQQDTGQLPSSVVNGAQGVLTTGAIANSHFYADNDADNKYTITVTLMDDDGDVDVETIEVTVLNVNPTLQPVVATDVNANTGTTTLTLTFSDPGADSFQIMVDWGDNLGIPNPADRFEVEQLYSGPTPNTFVIIHQYAGPPNPLNPTADIVISVKIRDDDFATLGVVQPGESNVQTAAISNPGIQTVNVAIDTTPNVPRLDLTEQPMVSVFISDQGGLTQLFQVPDVRGGGGEVAATTERYLELRIVFPDGSESPGFRIKDEALADLRAFFKTLPDGRYAIYLVRTENQSERLVIEVDVRRGRVIDVSDDSEGTRDRPPTGEEESPQTVPLDQNPLLEAVPAGEGQGELEIRRQGERAEIGDNGDQRVSLSPPLLVSLSAAALAAQPWSRRVDAALAEADENAWRRLRRAGRTGRSGRLPRLAYPNSVRTAANLDYNKN